MVDLAVGIDPDHRLKRLGRRNGPCLGKGSVGQTRGEQQQDEGSPTPDNALHG
jgi:hypothetical protein